MQIITMASIEYKEYSNTNNDLSVQFIGINDSLVSNFEHEWNEIAQSLLKESQDKIANLLATKEILEKNINELIQERNASKRWFKRNDEKVKTLNEEIALKENKILDIDMEINLLKMNNVFITKELIEKTRKFLLSNGFVCISTSSSSGDVIIKNEVWQRKD